MIYFAQKTRLQQTRFRLKKSNEEGASYDDGTPT